MAPSVIEMPRPTKTYHYKAYDRILKHHAFSGAGKTILITGGAYGVGLQFSKAFASAGASRIVIISRSAEPQAEARQEIEALYPDTKVLTYQASVTDHAKITSILQEIGPIDVLVLNAAISHRRTSGVDLTVEEVQQVYNTNVIAPFALAKAYLSMEDPKQKTILNLTSAAAQMSGMGFLAYGSSKAAVTQIMQNLADECVQQGKDVKIVSFHPGAIWTAMTDLSVGDIIGEDNPIWEDPQLPAYFALWLAGEETRFLHGKYVWANWDVDELIALKEKAEGDKDFLRVTVEMREFGSQYQVSYE
ncbi:putative short-chain dehydrogenase [Naviculisporaceae sp. PSN 640]